jgi:hypothetical protein
MAKRPRNRTLDNYLPIIQDMESADDRTAAIVGASLVENNLVMVIMNRLRDSLDDTEIKRLFDDRGAVLGTFANRVDIGFGLNLYDKPVRDDLDRIREIRNRFAHHLEVRTFDHPDVAGKCDALNASKYFGIHVVRRPAPPTRKHIYIDTAAFLAINFDIEATKARRPLKPMFLQYVWSMDL